MKYFAKWLPKPGGFSRTIKSQEGIPYDFEYEVECYLCTDDIPLLTKYFIEGDSVEYTRVFGDGEYKWHKPENSYRILGEILNSEGIEEGQEFTEREVRYELALKT